MLYINDNTVLEPEDIVELRLRNEACCFKLGPEYDYFTELDILRILVDIGIVDASAPKTINLSSDLTATEQTFKALVPIKVCNTRSVSTYDTERTMTINYNIEFKNPK